MQNLVNDAREGDQKAFSEIAVRYAPLIAGLRKRYAGDGIEAEEVEQEALIALYSAVLNWREDEGVTFGLYAKICMRNRIVSYLRRHNASLAPEAEHDPDQVENIPDSGSDPEQRMLENEQYERLLRIVSETLSELEQKVLTLYLRDMSYTEIARRLDVSEKTVDNAIYRLKAKLRKRI